jgi:hypothetical protein
VLDSIQRMLRVDAVLVWRALLHAGGGAVLPRLGRPAAAHHPL